MRARFVHEGLSVLRGPSREEIKHILLPLYTNALEKTTNLYDKYKDGPYPSAKLNTAKAAIAKLGALDAIENNDTGPREAFRVGEKQMHVLNFIRQAEPNGGVRYTDIIRFVYELGHGKWTYTSENRGYWSGAFRNGGGYWGGHVTAWIPRSTYKKGDKYFINGEGEEILLKRAKKFNYDIETVEDADLKLKEMIELIQDKLDSFESNSEERLDKYLTGRR